MKLTLSTAQPLGLPVALILFRVWTGSSACITCRRDDCRDLCHPFGLPCWHCDRPTGLATPMLAVCFACWRQCTAQTPAGQQRNAEHVAPSQPPKPRRRKRPAAPTTADLFATTTEGVTTDA